VVIDFLPDELLEEHAAGRDPAMVAVGREAIAVAEGPVMHDDPTDTTARTRGEMCWVTALKMNHRRRHDLPPLTACAPLVSFW
jgi:hypothetical protein